MGIYTLLSYWTDQLAWPVLVWSGLLASESPSGSQRSFKVSLFLTAEKKRYLKLSSLSCAVIQPCLSARLAIHCSRPTGVSRVLFFFVMDHVVFRLFYDTFL